MSGPRFSVLMPAYEPRPELLARAVRSVVDQHHRDWELIVIDDGSRDVDVTGILREATTDERVRLARRPSTGGVVAASVDGLHAAVGRYVTFVGQEDLLAPVALERCAAVLDEYPDCDLLYTDEDWIGMDDVRIAPFLKPTWSPERLRSQNYVSRLAVYPRRLVEELGGFRAGLDGSHDHELALRVAERARRVVHLPEILYHSRRRPGQAVGSRSPAVDAATCTAIEEHAHRTGVDCWVEQVDPLGIYRLHRRVKDTPLVSVVMPTRGSSGVVWGEHRVFVVEAVRSIVERSSYPNIEVVVVADEETPEKTIGLLEELCGDRLHTVWYRRPFNYAHKVNLGVCAANGDYVMLLNDDVEVISGDWIETMLGLAEQPDVGMVGAALYFEDGTFQHAGHLYLGGAAIGHIAYGVDACNPGPASGLRLERECSGVTAACALLRRTEFFAVGGLSRRFPLNFNDVDLSFKLRSVGRRIVWTPFAKLYHFESKTRPSGISDHEVAAIRGRWGRLIDAGDSYWRHADEEWADFKAGKSSTVTGSV